VASAASINEKGSNQQAAWHRGSISKRHRNIGNGMVSSAIFFVGRHHQRSCSIAMAAKWRGINNKENNNNGASVMAAANGGENGGNNRK
jgi:hypothetical protein